MTLVLTDVEGSTRLWADHPDVMSAVMGRHHQIVHGAITAHGGWRPVDQGEGDAVFAAFESPTAAVTAVARFQRELAAEPWPAGIGIRVRVGVHTGEVTARDGNVYGSTVNRCARLRGLGAGGQVLVSASTWELVRDRLPDGIRGRDLGEHRMKDLTRPEHVHQLDIDGLPGEFPPLASLDRARHNLPIQASSFLGREQEITRLLTLVRSERLVTVTAFGGMGKTRLALHVAAELTAGDGDGVWLVELSAVTEAAQLPSLVAATLGIAETAEGPLPSLLAGLAGRRLLLILDNLEQLLPDAARTVADIAAAGPGIHVLVTSREPLRIRGEQIFPLAPLLLPPPPRPPLTDAEVSRLSTFAAVSLFVSRATAARPDFALTAANAADVAAICTRLDGLPLALELAAARTRLLSPDALLPRLENALKVLTGGSRDLPARHQTLRATIAWSYGALDPDQRTLLDRLSVFPGTFSLDAAEAVCGPGLSNDDNDLDVLDGLGVLVDRSLVQLHPTVDGLAGDRYDLLVSIRAYAAEQLHAAGLTLRIAGRHAAYFTAAATYPADSTWDDIDRVDRLRRDELHHLRAALSYLNAHGTPAEEQLLAAHASEALYGEGLQTGAEAVTAQALSRSSAPTAGRVLLLAGRAFRGWARLNWDDARSDADAAVATARQWGDAALLVHALIEVLPTCRTVGEYRDYVADADALLAAPPPLKPGLPWLWVRYRWDRALAYSPFTAAEDAEAAFRRQLTEASERRQVRVELNLALLLCNQSRWKEAEDILQPWETSDGPPDVTPIQRMIGAISASEMRMARGQVEQAQSDVDLLDRLVRDHDVPDWAQDVQMRRSALDRLRGHPERALPRLLSVIEDSATSATDRAYGRRLAAVLSREIGELDNAAKHLEQAWRYTAEQGTPAVELAAHCLLERATQVADTDPAEAVRLIGLVRNWRPVARIADYGVVYDMTAMLDGLRERLGGDVVDAILTDASTAPLPDRPDWSTSPEAHQAHAVDSVPPPS